MIYRLLAYGVVCLHFGFVLFALAGGLTVLRWKRLAWIHLPVVAWGVMIEFADWVCPLTPLEKWLRLRAGGIAYEGGFLEHYLLPVLYPAGVTRGLQIFLGLFVFMLNLAVYAWVIRRRSRQGEQEGAGRRVSGAGRV